MKIELILLGIIGVVFLIDFLLKGRKKNTENSEITVHVKEKKQSYKTTWTAWVFLILGGLIFGVFIDFLFRFSNKSILDKDFYDWDRIIDYVYYFEFYPFLGNLIIGFLIFTLPFYLKRKLGFKYILNYILNRKKNISIFIIIIPILKTIFHYLIYPIMIQDCLNCGTRRRASEAIYGEKHRATLGDHFDKLFIDEIFLFIPAIIIPLILVWFFNDKIKAR